MRKGERGIWNSECGRGKGEFGIRNAERGEKRKNAKLKRLFFNPPIFKVCGGEKCGKIIGFNAFDFFIKG